MFHRITDPLVQSGPMLMRCKLDWIWRGLAGRNETAKLYTLARRHPQQVGSTPDNVVLKVVHAAVNVNNLPHHLDSSLAAFVVKNIIEPAGEMINVNRISGGFGGVTNQLRRCRIVESEGRFQNGLKLFPPCLLPVADHWRLTEQDR